MSDEQNTADNLDEDVLGEGPDGELPGLYQQGETGPMSSEDPTLVAGGADGHDDEATRAWREEAEAGTDGAVRSPRDLMSLLEADEVGPDQIDDEAQMIGEDTPISEIDAGPEERALHLDQTGDHP